MQSLWLQYSCHIVSCSDDHSSGISGNPAHVTEAARACTDKCSRQSTRETTCPKLRFPAFWGKELPAWGLSKNLHDHEAWAQLVDARHLGHAQSQYQAPPSLINRRCGPSSTTSLGWRFLLWCVSRIGLLLVLPWLCSRSSVRQGPSGHPHLMHQGSSVIMFLPWPWLRCKPQRRMWFVLQQVLFVLEAASISCAATDAVCTF